MEHVQLVSNFGRINITYQYYIYASVILIFTKYTCIKYQYQVHIQIISNTDAGWVIVIVIEMQVKVE